MSIPRKARYAWAAVDLGLHRLRCGAAVGSGLDRPIDDDEGVGQGREVGPIHQVVVRQQQLPGVAVAGHRPHEEPEVVVVVAQWREARARVGVSAHHAGGADELIAHPRQRAGEPEDRVQAAVQCLVHGQRRILRRCEGLHLRPGRRAAAVGGEDPPVGEGRVPGPDRVPRVGLADRRRRREGLGGVARGVRRVRAQHELGVVADAVAVRVQRGVGRDRVEVVAELRGEQIRVALPGDLIAGRAARERPRTALGGGVGAAAGLLLASRHEELSPEDGPARARVAARAVGIGGGMTGRTVRHVAGALGDLRPLLAQRGGRRGDGPRGGSRDESRQQRRGKRRPRGGRRSPYKPKQARPRAESAGRWAATVHRRIIGRRDHTGQGGALPRSGHAPRRRGASTRSRAPTTDRHGLAAARGRER